MRRKAAASYHHGDLRRALLAVAFDILKSKGLEALSLREVAREAGVSHQAPYHHFPSRAHLLAALAAEGFTQLGDELETVQAATADPVQQAQETGIRYVVFASRNPERFRLMFGAAIGSRAPYPDLEDAAQRVFALLVRPFGRPPRGPGSSFDPVVLTLWSAVHGLAALAVDGQIPLHGKALAEAARATTEQVWFGVRDALMAK